jgi:magnesium transporter
MISKYIFDGTRLRPCLPDEPPVWIDLLRPDEDEIAEIDKTFALNLPTLEEMREIEISSRLYEEDDSHYMTFMYISDALGEQPKETPFTFMLKDNLLVTIRYKDMRVISSFIERAGRQGLASRKYSTDLMVLILENIIDLCSDALEKGHTDIEAESLKTFDSNNPNKNYQQSLEQIARIGDLNSKMRESLVSLNRLSIYLTHAVKHMKVSKETVTKLEAHLADVQSLLDHTGFVSNKISFMLDATLGFVNIEQNAIIKIFSVAAVIFLPPTLVASIYGMNFRHMPELEWEGGYPVAIALMIISAILPCWYFKRRKWL